MTPAFFFVMSNANFAALSDPQIQGSVSDGTNTYFITGNLTPPGNTLYACRINADGSFLVSQSKQPAFNVVHDTFLGWAIPA